MIDDRPEPATPPATTSPLEVDRHHSAGGLVVRDGREVLLISPAEGRWQLPKGHLEAGEQSADAALREVLEETGVEGRIVAPLPSIDYRFAGRGGRVVIEKRVDYFLMDYAGGDVSDLDPREVESAGWFAWSEALERLTFDNEREVVETARKASRGRRAASAEEWSSPRPSAGAEAPA